MASDSLHILLQSRRVEDRIRGVQKLARSESPDRERWLLSLLDDRAHYVAALAAEALRDGASWEACNAMVERFRYFSEDGLKRDPGCHIRAHLAFTFGQLEHSPASEVLRVGIRTVQIEAVGGVPFDTGLHLRANCALALAQLHAPDAARDIAFLLFDMGTGIISKDPARAAMEARKAAAQALARLGDHCGLLPLALRLKYPKDELPEVLQECMQAVVELEDARALELLTPYLHHNDELLAGYAALMIARTRVPEAPVLLREAAGRLSGNALKAVALALTTLRTEEAQHVLLALSTDAREAARLAVVEAWSGTQDELESARLKEMAMKDRSLAVRNAAKRVLEA